MNQILSFSDECVCKNQVWRYRIHSNGTKHWGTQCLYCGKWFSRKKTDVPQAEQNRCGEYDKSILEAHQDRMRDVWKAQSEQIRTERRTEYLEDLSEYYKTPEWDRKRRARLKLNSVLFNGYCEMCLKNRATHVHHLTYARKGREWLLDLAAICEGCHIEEHPHMQDEA